MPPIIRTGSIRLGSGHSLIAGHGPIMKDIAAPKTELELKQHLERFGLFNLATPDTHTFYKDVTTEDLSPKAEDYYKPIFRGLSEVIVRKSHDPIDFGHEAGVLKASMNLMIGQTVFSNHEAFVGNEKGVVSRVFWDEAYKMGDILVPAGFNMEFLIDGKSHPKLVRDLQSDPPTVHSNSVTVNFKWAQSHTKMDLNEFRGKVGTFDAKGQLIRRIVTEVVGYHETSFVAHGADPFAQIIKDGKINNPVYAHARDSFSEEKKVSLFFSYSFKESLSEITIPNSTINNDDEENKMKKFPKELILLLAAMAGVSLSAEDTSREEADFQEHFDFDAFADSLSAENSITALTALSEGDEDEAGLTAQITTLKADKIKLEADLAEANKFKTDNAAKLADVALVDTHRASLLADVLRLSNLVDKKNADKLKPTYEAANLQTLTAFQTTLTSQLEEKFPMSCKSCGSEEINRATSSNGEDDEEKKPKTVGAVIGRISNKASIAAGSMDDFFEQP